MSITPNTLLELGKYDTPTICNVIELFDIRPFDSGYTDPRIQCKFPELPPMVGFASTAYFRSSNRIKERDVYDDIQEQIENFDKLLGPAVMAFQDLDDPPVGATFGEVMCTTYQAFGAKGLITSGAGRDLAQVRELGFPVFTGSTICSHAYCQLSNIGESVQVGGLVISHGDLIHGDLNGVTVIPLEIASEVADAAREFIQAEKVILEYMNNSSEKTVPGMSEARIEYESLIRKLKARVRKQ